MTVIEIGRELAKRGLPAFAGDIEENEGGGMDTSDGAALRKRDKAVVVGTSGITFRRCGGGWQVVRKQKRRD